MSFIVCTLVPLCIIVIYEQYLLLVYDSILSVFEWVLSALVDIRSTNEVTFGGPVLIVVDRRNMQ